MRLQDQAVQEEEELSSRRVVFAGVGNTLAGDDGVGIFMVRLLRQRLSGEHHFEFVELEGDLYQIWDILPGAGAFIFLDAVAGDEPGLIRVGKTLPRAFTPSFHQSDLSAVLDSLEKLWDGGFPPWTVWGVTIDPPETLREGLTPSVERAAREAVDRLAAKVQSRELSIEGTCILPQ